MPKYDCGFTGYTRKGKAICRTFRGIVASSADAAVAEAERRAAEQVRNFSALRRRIFEYAEVKEDNDGR
jgi:hypothetical protein